MVGESLDLVDLKNFHSARKSTYMVLVSCLFDLDFLTDLGGILTELELLV